MSKWRLELLTSLDNEWISSLECFFGKTIPSSYNDAYFNSMVRVSSYDLIDEAVCEISRNFIFNPNRDFYFFIHKSHSSV